LRRWGPFAACAVIALLLAQCSSQHIDYGVSASPRVVDSGEPIPKGGGTYRVGSPYFVGGRMYVPQYDPHYQAVGLASWYGEDFHGRNTANGEVFDLDSISAAHPTMPLPSYARVTNLANGRSIIVRVNDRGPYAHNRIIDLSVRAAKLLDFYRRGTTSVRVEYVGPAPLQGSDDRVLEATLRENGPAPVPSMVRIARGPVFPPTPPPPSSRRVIASVPPDYLPPEPSETAEPRYTAGADPDSMSYTNRPNMDGTSQYLNGRGLY
jgi:rare lipoprotein A